MSTSSLRLPRLSREAEARRPRAPIVETKRGVTSSIESAEFVQDEDWDVTPAVKIEIDPRQLRAGIAALAIQPPPSSPSSSTSGEAAATAPGPSQWGVRSSALTTAISTPFELETPGWSQIQAEENIFTDLS